MDLALALQYFAQIHGIWRPFSDQYRIIPFCTPVIYRPTALIIGKNHSDFAPGDSTVANVIADRYALELPTINTFVDHNHSFATGIRSACADAGITVDERWMGTNRCAVQTDSSGIAHLKRNREFASCQSAMDELLRRFVSEVRPINLILAGSYAADLYYSNRGAGIEDLACQTLVHVFCLRRIWKNARFGLA